MKNINLYIMGIILLNIGNSYCTRKSTPPIANGSSIKTLQQKSLSLTTQKKGQIKPSGIIKNSGGLNLALHKRNEFTTNSLKKKGKK